MSRNVFFDPPFICRVILAKFTDNRSCFYELNFTLFTLFHHFSTAIKTKTQI